MEPRWPNGYRVRLISGPQVVPGRIGLIIRSSLRPSNGRVSRGSWSLVSMQEQVKDPIQGEKHE
jgi:hypothetical protein